MKNSVYKKILEKRARFLEKQLTSLDHTSVCLFIDLDVGLLIRERNTLRAVLRQTLKEIEGGETVSHNVYTVISEIVEDDDL
jgi:hypothetical protein